MRSGSRASPKPVYASTSVSPLDSFAPHVAMNLGAIAPGDLEQNLD
jgi:hypothetical protein